MSATGRNRRLGSPNTFEKMAVEVLRRKMTLKVILGQKSLKSLQNHILCLGTKEKQTNNLSK